MSRHASMAAMEPAVSSTSHSPGGACSVRTCEQRAFFWYEGFPFHKKRLEVYNLPPTMRGCDQNPRTGLPPYKPKCKNCSRWFAQLAGGGNCKHPLQCPVFKSVTFNK